MIKEIKTSFVKSVTAFFYREIDVVKFVKELNKNKSKKEDLWNYEEVKIKGVIFYAVYR